MKKNNSDPIADLTAETTKLLNEVAGQKDRLQTLANTSESNVKVSKSHADRAGVESLNSFNEAERSKKEATRSMVEADRSQTAANRAELVSGMDTAQQLVDVAVTESFVPVQAQIDAVQANTKLAIVHAPLDNKLSLHAGIGEPVFVKSANQSVQIPAQNIKVGAETVTIPQQAIVIEGQEIEVPDAQQIKFSRASKAWLDGKEYGVDEPRYTADGKLLVESQATNYIPNSRPICFNGTYTPIPDEDAYIATQTNLDVDQAVLYYADPIRCATNTQLAMSITFHPQPNSYYRFNANSLTEGSTCTLNNGSFAFVPADLDCGIEYLSGGWVKLWMNTSTVGGEESNHNTHLYFSGNVKVRRSTQLELGDKPTSFIPTTTTAVTRAADIALINGQNIVNRWENDQQPIDTDTPRLLANGEHDMSADRLVKFGRSTSAWLDGVEYVAGEPRYKDGKLLVEGQNTNYMPTAFPYNLTSYLADWTTTVVDGWAVLSAQSGAGSLSYFNLLETNYNTKMNMSMLVKKTADYWFRVTVFIGSDVIGKRADYKFDLPLPVDDENFKTVDYGDYLHITLNATFGSDGYKIFRIYPNFDPDLTNRRDFVFKDLMISDGSESTSHIPTNGTAVTRAADYAHVISKQAINTPTGLLPIGEHSVEPTAIRSFKRDTVAWLDGVEYPANTPRYLPNGQLFIESQNTNYMATAFPYNFSLVTDDPLTSYLWSSENEWANCRLSLGETHVGYFDISGSATLYNTLMSAQLTVKKTADYCFMLRCYNNHGGVRWGYLFTAGEPHPTGANLTITDDNDESFTITASEHFEGVGYAIFRIFPNTINSTTRDFIFKDLMTMLGDKPTSHIPTNGTAVTRAADECFVDYQLPPNTYRDLKGFKK